MLRLEQVFVVLKCEHFGKWIKNIWKACNVVLEKNGGDQMNRSCEK